MKNLTHARRQRRQRARRRADLTAAYAILAEAAPFFDTVLGARLAEAVENGEQPEGWTPGADGSGELNGSGTCRAMPSKARSHERAF